MQLAGVVFGMTLDASGSPIAVYSLATLRPSNYEVSYYLPYQFGVRVRSHRQQPAAQCHRN